MSTSISLESHNDFLNIGEKNMVTEYLRYHFPSKKVTFYEYVLDKINNEYQGRIKLSEIKEIYHSYNDNNIRLHTYEPRYVSNYIDIPFPSIQTLKTIIKEGNYFDCSSQQGNLVCTVCKTKVNIPNKKCFRYSDYYMCLSCAGDIENF